MTDFRAAADTVLNDVVSRAGGVPGVVAMVTNRDGEVYTGSGGQRVLGGEAAMSPDSVMLLASCTKAVTGVAVMQLVEEGAISLKDAAKDYVPEIADIQVLEGLSDSGEAKLRPPKSDVTVEQLLLHTAGFGYEFLNADLLKYRVANECAPTLGGTFEALQDVLLFDPGTRWEYGTNIDWAGKVAEAVRGKRLGEIFAEHVFAPLDIKDIAFSMTDNMKERLATVHQRNPDGQLVPNPDLVLPQDAQMDMGGHALYGTVPEYIKFIRMLLNDGDGPNGRVLKPETVNQLSQNGLGDLKVGAFPAAIPEFINAGEMFPGLSKSWAYTFLVNDEDAPTGRPAGSLAWAGIANTFYWIDRKNGVGGMWSSQIMPFIDIAAYPGYLEFESTVYRHLGEL